MFSDSQVTEATFGEAHKGASNGSPFIFLTYLSDLTLKTRITNSIKHANLASLGTTRRGYLTATFTHFTILPNRQQSEAPDSSNIAEETEQTISGTILNARDEADFQNKNKHQKKPTPTDK
jgi:hypothetical protein